MDPDLHKIDWEKARVIFSPEKETFLKKIKTTWEKYPEAEDVLKIIAGIGVVGMCLVMPGLGKYVAKEIGNHERRRYNRMWKRWEKSKIVEIDYSQTDPIIRITEKGLKKALQFKLKDLKLKRPLNWDKKWRVIIFDVPEWKRKSRDYFRQNLVNLGFHQLNKSVFIYPFSCFDEVEYLRQISGIGKEVTYMTVVSIESGTNLKQIFDLS